MEFLDQALQKVIEMLTIDDYLKQAYDYIVALSPLPKVLGLLGGSLVIFMGLWQLIKTLSKFIIVVAIIAALFFLFDSKILDGIIG